MRIALAHRVDNQGKFCCPKCLERDYRIKQVTVTPKGLFRFLAECRRCKILLEYEKEM